MANIVKTNRKVRSIGISECVIYLQTLNNNFRATVCTFTGNVLHTASAGKFVKGSKKSTPFAANITVEDVATWCKDHGITTVHVRIRGPVNEMAIRVLSGKLAIKSIRNITNLPHAGCKPRKKPRK